ncbi:NAD(P)H-hydrate dehydratase [Pleomorphovibrio marinus]|uniref:NAD(P)H-hydrate dehydratase n=1 Tax=Pleomorphovibrio marinus TaxID=2164132 RepID=UPI000E0BC1AB|nr:NAD(P)H-hydrate dehydratase [Pleomorphovibrio marinus]
MQRIISGKQVKKIDQAYISHAQITSTQLMERAAKAFYQWFCSTFEREKAVGIYVGTGNNGGDGLAIARLLHESGYKVKVIFCGDLNKASEDFSINKNLLPESVGFFPFDAANPPIPEEEIIVDAVFGVGINRPLEGEYLDLINHMNQVRAHRVSVDMPSGLPADELLEGAAFEADYTVSFQFPKFSLLLPEHAKYTGTLVVKDIGIDMGFFDEQESNRFWVGSPKVGALHRKFHAFSHKGDFGKVLLVGGSYGKIGAILLSTKAALRTGSGLVSTFCPSCGVEIIQSGVPEAMVIPGKGEKELAPPLDISAFDAVGVGPGMGQAESSAILLKELLESAKVPMVLDADALNILATHKDWYGFLEGHILTPHLKEFERLAGVCENQIQRLALARDFAIKHQCVLVLKGAHTCTNLPNGDQYFNSSGTPYLGTGGTGDVLTGVITSFLGQGYSPENAAITGIFHHGLAGNIAAKEKLRGMLASDVIEAIPQTYLDLGLG